METGFKHEKTEDLAKVLEAMSVVNDKAVIDIGNALYIKTSDPERTTTAVFQNIGSLPYRRIGDGKVNVNIREIVEFLRGTNAPFVMIARDRIIKLWVGGKANTISSVEHVDVEEIKSSEIAASFWIDPATFIDITKEVIQDAQFITLDIKPRSIRIRNEKGKEVVIRSFRNTFDFYDVKQPTTVRYPAQKLMSIVETTSKIFGRMDLTFYQNGILKIEFRVSDPEYLLYYLKPA